MQPERQLLPQVPVGRVSKKCETWPSVSRTPAADIVSSKKDVPHSSNERFTLENT